MKAIGKATEVAREAYEVYLCNNKLKEYLRTVTNSTSTDITFRGATTCRLLVLAALQINAHVSIEYVSAAIDLSPLLSVVLIYFFHLSGVSLTSAALCSLLPFFWSDFYCSFKYIRIPIYIRSDTKLWRLSRHLFCFIARWLILRNVTVTRSPKQIDALLVVSRLINRNILSIYCVV